MTEVPPINPKGRGTLGLVLIAIGIVLVLDQSGTLKTEGLSRWWPLLLIGIGFVKFRQPLEDGQRAAGLALLCVGGFFQATSVLSLINGWPLIMVAAGGFLVWQGLGGTSGAPKPPAESPFVSELALLGFSKRSLHPSELRGGYITAVMGVVEVDLAKATIGASPAYLDVVAFWGGIGLKVPPHWTVDAQVVPILGAFENKAQSVAEPGTSPRLVVRGHAIMGAVGITN